MNAKDLFNISVSSVVPEVFCCCWPTCLAFAVSWKAGLQPHGRSVRVEQRMAMSTSVGKGTPQAVDATTDERPRPDGAGRPHKTL